MKQKKGQMNISFGMIFSIILIIVFLGFAFLAIQKFLGFQNDVTEKKFYDALSQDVNQVWTSTKASKQVEYIIPRGTTQVCFKNDPFKNVYLFSDKPSLGETIDHLNITKIICIDTINGKVNFLLEKSYGENFVEVNEIK
ncbi:MAG TPA: hypothetical protein HA284_03045 [Nanoarchaeota archaeon]|nr:hypothetical protein [Nanoarchaeota archaeon]